MLYQVESVTIFNTWTSIKTKLNIGNYLESELDGCGEEDFIKENIRRLVEEFVKENPFNNEDLGDFIKYVDPNFFDVQGNNRWYEILTGKMIRYICDDITIEAKISL